MAPIRRQGAIGTPWSNRALGEGNGFVTQWALRWQPLTEAIAAIDTAYTRLSPEPARLARLAHSRHCALTGHPSRSQILRPRRWRPHGFASLFQLSRAEQVQRADLIVRATVGDQRSAFVPERGAILTWSTLHVTSVLKGQAG